MTAAGDGAPEPLHAFVRGKVRRHLQLLVALACGAAATLAFLFQGSIHHARPGPARVVAPADAAATSAPEPQLASLRDELARQAGGDPPVPDAIRPHAAMVEAGSATRIARGSEAVPEEDDKAEDRRLARYEADKRDTVIAGSRILAISRPQSEWGATGRTRAAAGAADALAGQAEAQESTRPDLAAAGALPAVADAAGARVLLRGRTLSSPGATATAAMPSTARVEDPVSPHVLLQGTVIPAVLITQINSDLPGMITAQVTEDVHDSVSGHFMLIPRGSRLIGDYGAEMTAGQSRLVATFRRLIFPDGSSIQLDAMQGTDPAGQTGLHDQVDNRFWSRLGTQFLVAALARVVQRGDGTAAVIGSGGTVALGDAAGQILVDTARGNLQRNIGIAPTVVIRRGYRFDVMVNRDLVLRPRASGPAPGRP